MSEDTRARSNRYVVVESPPGTHANVFHVEGYLRHRDKRPDGSLTDPEWRKCVFPLMPQPMGQVVPGDRSRRIGTTSGGDAENPPAVGRVFEWEFVTREPDSWSPVVLVPSEKSRELIAERSALWKVQGKLRELDGLVRRALMVVSDRENGLWLEDAEDRLDRALLSGEKE